MAETRAEVAATGATDVTDVTVRSRARARIDRLPAIPAMLPHRSQPEEPFVSAGRAVRSRTPDPRTPGTPELRLGLAEVHREQLDERGGVPLVPHLGSDVGRDRSFAPRLLERGDEVLHVHVLRERLGA